MVIFHCYVSSPEGTTWPTCPTSHGPVRASQTSPTALAMAPRKLHRWSSLGRLRRRLRNSPPEVQQQKWDFSPTCSNPKMGFTIRSFHMAQSKSLIYLSTMVIFRSYISYISLAKGTLQQSLAENQWTSPNQFDDFPSWKPPYFVRGVSMFDGRGCPEKMDLT